MSSPARIREHPPGDHPGRPSHVRRVEPRGWGPSAGGDVVTQRERGWAARNAKWLAFGTIPAALAVFAAMVFGGLYVLSVFMRSNDACREAVARAQAHPAVQAALGTPVEVGTFVFGKVHESDTGGSVDVDLSLAGPKGGACLSVLAAKSGGTWRFSRLEVIPESGRERIDLLAPGSYEGPAEAVPGR